jgi:DNA modification methylase
MESNKIICGGAPETLKTLPSESIHCCITSPPYYGLRDYGADGQIGLEQTPEEYIARLVEVFREVKRVLRNDGTLWIVIADSYAGSGKGAMSEERLRATRTKQSYLFSVDNPAASSSRTTYPSLPCCDTKACSLRRSSSPQRISDSSGVPLSKTWSGIKPKDMIGIPWALAFALRDDGWYLRSDVIWRKPNALPESCRDRPTRSYEHVFLLSKSYHYYYDQEAVKEPVAAGTHARLRRAVSDKHKYAGAAPGQTQQTFNRPRPNRSGVEVKFADTRNLRDVWDVTTKAYHGAHFAVFPVELITPCVLAGCPAGGVVLDPFFGSGTTGAAALTLGRRYIGIDLNPDYCALAAERLKGVTADVET